MTPKQFDKVVHLLYWATLLKGELGAALFVLGIVLLAGLLMGIGLQLVVP
jgi:hypothetical protein